MTFFDRLCSPDLLCAPDVCAPDGPSAEDNGDFEYERGEFAAAAAAWTAIVDHYETPHARYPLSCASMLSARTWLRLGLCLQAHASADSTYTCDTVACSCARHV